MLLIIHYLLTRDQLIDIFDLACRRHTNKQSELPVGEWVLARIQTESVLLYKVVVAAISVLVKYLFSGPHRLRIVIVLNEEGLETNGPPAIVVDVTETCTIPNGFHLGG